MSTYLISYDLNKPGKDYTSLSTAIKNIAVNWWHHLDSVWIIKHNGPAASIRNSLRSYIDQNDELLVVTLDGEGAWAGFTERGSEWLKANL